ncbi:hypothetical protein ACFODL_15370 [Phenylobacterium terrae]|uniref:Uncharacterized protein n=1 Tax=Phenylobacterium terrae TaxID=2665495 RepID=A0ABW4N6N7_9CAUL
MSSDRPHDSPSKPHYPKRKIPPLVWIIVAIFVGWAVIFFVQREGAVETPSGGTHPTAEQAPAVAPATPVTPAAPGTPQTANPS